MASLRKFDWEEISGLRAAVAAIILHFLHLTDVNILRVLALVLVALLFLRDLRSEERWSSIEGVSKLSVRLLEEITKTTHPAEIDVIGSASTGTLRSKRRSRATRGAESSRHPSGLISTRASHSCSRSRTHSEARLRHSGASGGSHAELSITPYRCPTQRECS